MKTEVQLLREEIIRLSARIDQRPLRSTPAQPYLSVLIVSGNTLDTGQDGVLYESTEITSVPSAYDPDVTSSFIDGIGRGTLYVNGVAQDGYVLVINDTHSGSANAVRDGDLVWVLDQVSIPVDGGGAVSVYPIS